MNDKTQIIDTEGVQRYTYDEVTVITDMNGEPVKRNLFDNKIRVGDVLMVIDTEGFDDLLQHGQLVYAKSVSGNFVKTNIPTHPFLHFSHFMVIEQ